MTADSNDGHPNHLIIVCGHAIWTGGPTNGRDESEWVIEDWKKGETPTYIEHIKAGLKALNEDDGALLVFSGGPTASSTPESEARSYERLAHANNYWGLLPFEPRGTDTAATASPRHAPAPPPTGPAAAHARILLDARALDSYQNILFPLLAFWRATARARWPARLTVVSHAFKRGRLAGAHCRAALGLAPRRVAFVGRDPPGAAAPAVRAAEARAAAAWARDPHGRSAALRAKRRARNPHGVAQTLFAGEWERALAGVATVLSADGQEEFLVPGGPWPWARPEGDQTD